jgi:hypothetical protein
MKPAAGMANALSEDYIE